MKTRWLMVACLLAVALLAAPYAAASPTNTVTYDFEDSVTPFMPDGDMGHAHNTLLQGAGEVRSCIAEHGAHFALLSTSAPLRSTVIWFETSVAATGSTVVQLDWQGRSVANCVGCEMIAYAGDGPAIDTDFQAVGRATDDWQQFRYIAHFDAANTAYIAVGFRLSTLIPPMYNKAGIDCLQIQVSNGLPGK